MAGRPKKKPEYNAEKQFDNFLQELSAAYEEADSMRGLAQELNITLLKLRKLLITAGIFTSDICTEINELYKQRKSVPEIMQITGLSRASVHSYLPYCKGLYNAEELSVNAERCQVYRNRQTLLDYEVYVKIIIELKQLMNFNNEDFAVEHRVVGSN